MFDYLEIEISNCKNIYQEDRTKAHNAAGVSGSPKDLIWLKKLMNKESKVIIYKTAIRIILIYATDTRADTTTTLQTINTIDKVRNTTIRECCGIQVIKSGQEKEGNYGVNMSIEWHLTG